MTDHRFGRRTFLSGLTILSGGATAALVAGAGSGRAGTGRTVTADLPGDDTLKYEVVRSDAEWRNMLSDAEYRILREGMTEPAHSSPLAIGAEAGTYACKGCGLITYDGRWKVARDIGYAFFRHARADTVLTGIDEAAPNPDRDPAIDLLAGIEVHCRRCGSHLGHIYVVKGEQLHCINGAALEFTAATA